MLDGTIIDSIIRSCFIPAVRVVFYAIEVFYGIELLAIDKYKNDAIVTENIDLLLTLFNPDIHVSIAQD